MLISKPENYTRKKYGWKRDLPDHRDISYKEVYLLNNFQK